MNYDTFVDVPVSKKCQQEQDNGQAFEEYGVITSKKVVEVMNVIDYWSSLVFDLNYVDS